MTSNKVRVRRYLGFRGLSGLVGLPVVLMVAGLHGCSSDTGPGYVPEQTIFNNEGQVVIDGELLLGETLTAVILDEDGTGNASFQWASDSTDIEDATMSTFVLTEAELGSSMTVSVRYTDGFGFLEVLTSTPTPAVLAEANVDGAIAVVGVPVVGRTLTASISDGNGIENAMPSYTWFGGGVEISGATAQTYVVQPSDVGADITVAATYTDDIGFEESVMSPPFGPISETAVNVPGMLSVVGIPVVGRTLTAVVADPNGVGAIVTFQWFADGTAISGAAGPAYELTTADRRSVVSVTASYTDDDGFVEGPLSADIGDIVYTAIVVGEDSLRAAATTSTTGDAIGLASPADGDDYDAMAEIEFPGDDVLVRRTAMSSAVISGRTCLVFSGDGMVIDGLVFERLEWLGGTCDSSGGDSSIFLSGNGSVLRNCEFRSEAFPRDTALSATYHYVGLKGLDHLVERNLFKGKDMDKQGSAITMFANTTPMANQGHTVQYNLFRDMVGRSVDDLNSTAHAIQAGRTTGADAQGDGLFVIQYNRFDNVRSQRRVIRVQSSRNIIRGNTVVDSLGLIALEDGQGSTVTRNVILSNGEDQDDDDGGISFAPLRHAITDNYISNLRTGSGQRGGLLVNLPPLDNENGNGVIIDAGGDFTVTVARNTVVNARQAIIFDIDGTSCGPLAPLLDFDGNLVFNQSSNPNGSGRTAVIDGDFSSASCALDPASDFDDNHIYSATLSQSGAFDFSGAPGDNVVGDQDGIPFTVNDEGLLSGGGAAMGIGVDTSLLHVIQENEVGPGSDWVAP